MTAPPAARPSTSSLPLQRKLPLLILGLLASVLLICVLVSYYELRRTAESAVGTRLTSLSDVLSSLVQQQFAARFALMQRVAASPAVVQALQTPDRAPDSAAVQAVRSLAARADSTTPPMLIARDGRPLGSAMQLDTPAEEQAMHDELRAIVSTPESTYVGKLYRHAGHTSFWTAVPVRNGTTIVGYIAQERRFATNPRMLQPFRDLIGSDIELYFRNADGTMWTQLSGAPTTAPANANRFDDRLEVLTRAGAGAALASSAAIKGTPLLVTVEFPMQAVLDRPNSTARVLGAIALVLAAAGAAIAWLISRQLTQPLSALTAAAEGMAEGEYAQHVAADTGDEIGRLGNAFNRMARQVETSSKASAAAVERLTESVATQEFLAEASKILAISISDETLLADLARYCVPARADYCSIQIVGDDGAIHRVETAHYDPTKLPAVRALVREYEYQVDGPGEVPQVIRTQTPFLIPQLDRRAVLAAAPNETAARLLAEVGPTAFMCVPLVARGRTVGAMSFTMTDSGRTFDDDDLALAMELARRTAVAIDNALIYRRSLALRLEAEAASSAKSDFLAKMSHEIRTPINAMMGYAELLGMGMSGPVNEAQAKQLGRIRASGEHLTSLVNEILDLAKIEAGRMNVEPAVGLTGDAAESALALIRPQAAAKGVELTAKPDGNPTVEYSGDPQRVQQILTNLLSNAVKFTPAGGGVSVRCGCAKRPAPDGNGHSDFACIVVQDTGIGIAPEDMQRIFQPFVQVDSGYTRAHGGTGLGLTISRTLAEMMKGELNVESVPGEGSRFTLWLPSPNSCTGSA